MKDTKEHILGVALKLFLQKNFKEVTMKEIVIRTGLSKGAFYHYFESKEQLFREVIENLFMSSMLELDYEHFSKDSLYQFIRDYSKKSDGFMNKILENKENEDDSVFSMNFYLLIFDSLKIIPGFREKMEEHHVREMQAWISAIKHARKRGEIRSTLSDKQIAEIFIFTGDGLAMNQILGGKLENLKENMLKSWVSYYNTLKV